MDYIVFENVSKIFSGNTVLENVNFSLSRGDIAGFSGRNGTGKTVLFKMLAGLIKPTGGTVTVDGEPLGNSFIKSAGMMIETPGFIPHYSGLKNLKILNSISEKKADIAVIKSLMKELSLDPESDKQVSKYSLGMRQKLGIIQAVMNDPEILILDEPVNSLDAASAAAVLDMLKKINAEKNTTILIASHINEELTGLCRRRFILDGNTLKEEPAV
ncbi:MAG: ABC transporter ATP-binding protein [Ruminococcus sp.]|jgi:ABC-2 type transport system ATP-binding protein|nr:ABC transporter ATP-binding protein [Ruminococcus sp.]